MTDAPPSARPRVNCLDCVHFRVTWDADNPRGCAIMGFKGKRFPSLEVLAVSGQECLKFTPKARGGAAPQEIPATPDPAAGPGPMPAPARRSWVV